ncbi:sugar-binding transcriptional regulator [Natroniella sulfidigena]|uniref:sugar-binding transcriptional regulator n=1 Tax=Natroniella sulfidigena TaxID=723921 RepID=UPI00200A0BC6|nr:sugar-binding domain-containing protein [Natroniella sulfidigena]MCK8817188.1 sugar-binding transcriptional regulator [Natroniella sulfidigena]
MVDYFKLQQEIAPELIKMIEKRYGVLKNISRLQPIGRRSLANKLNLSERTVRNHLVFFREKDFIEITAAGTKITVSGERILWQLDGYIKELRGTTNLERQLKQVLGIDVYIVPNGLGTGQDQEELGRFAADFLKDLISKEDIIAVTGGTTLATVAEMMVPCQEDLDVTVVPARGGLGEGVEIQANTIGAKISDKLGGEYHLLHIPDNLKEETISRLLTEDSIQGVLELSKQADILVHGIGTAEVMAERRSMPLAKIEQLKSVGAVGEAFGYYFDQAGEIVYSTTSVGLKLSELVKIKKVIAIAGGKSKAKAILAVISARHQDILITDEEAAKAILELTK